MRNSRSKNDHNFPRRDMTTIAMSLSSELLDVIQREYAPLKNAAKILARHAGATPRAARNWLARDCCPQLDHVAELIRNCRAVRETFRQHMDKTE